MIRFKTKPNSPVFECETHAQVVDQVISWECENSVRKFGLGSLISFCPVCDNGAVYDTRVLANTVKMSALVYVTAQTVIRNERKFFERLVAFYNEAERQERILMEFLGSGFVERNEPEKPKLRIIK